MLPKKRLVKAVERFCRQFGDQPTQALGAVLPIDGLQKLVDALNLAISFLLTVTTATTSPLRYWWQRASIWSPGSISAASPISGEADDSETGPCPIWGKLSALKFV